MADEKRVYRKKQRAELEAQTRLRITESTVELHGTVGPARTSISSVAERAGVRRSTVHRALDELEPAAGRRRVGSD
jgi:AcrR family transcriptional regulator